MLSKQDILRYLRENKNLFQSKYHVVKLGLFGSFARGEETEKSDIDILVEFDNEAEDIFGKRLDIIDIITEKFTRHVDLCIESGIKPVFKKIILDETVYV
ncbi:MAG: nucleotidyltransferase family protein [Bacteroidia bacterium]|nr:nucleotidyltransferase family protein [Bacteroidia bacterium]